MVMTETSICIKINSSVGTLSAMKLQPRRQGDHSRLFEMEEVARYRRMFDDVAKLISSLILLTS